jgi:hypothetical protein
MTGCGRQNTGSSRFIGSARLAPDAAFTQTVPVAAIDQDLHNLREQLPKRMVIYVQRHAECLSMPLKSIRGDFYVGLVCYELGSGHSTLIVTE